MVQVNVALTGQLLKDVDDFQLAHGYLSRYAASMALIKKGLGREDYDRKAHRARNPKKTNPIRVSQGTIRGNEQENREYSDLNLEEPAE